MFHIGNIIIVTLTWLQSQYPNNEWRPSAVGLFYHVDNLYSFINNSLRTLSARSYLARTSVSTMHWMDVFRNSRPPWIIPSAAIHLLSAKESKFIRSILAPISMVVTVQEKNICSEYTPLHRIASYWNYGSTVSINSNPPPYPLNQHPNPQGQKTAPPPLLPPTPFNLF